MYKTNKQRRRADSILIHIDACMTLGTLEQLLREIAHTKNDIFARLKKNFQRYLRNTDGKEVRELMPVFVERFSLACYQQKIRHISMLQIKRSNRDDSGIILPGSMRRIPQKVHVYCDLSLDQLFLGHQGWQRCPFLYSFLV